MNRSSILRKPLAVLAAIGVVAAAVTVAGSVPASAAQIGTLTFNGLTTQESAFSVTTSGFCPEPATNFLITLEGGNIPNPSASPNLTGNTSEAIVAGGINAAPFTTNSSKTLLLFASGNGLASLGNGTYTATLVCRTALASASLGDFVGQFTVSGNAVTPIAPASPDATTTAVTPSTVTPSWGAPVALSAAVANTDVPALKPVGSVEFFDGVTSLGSAATVNGVATRTVASLGLGAHSITAVYTPTSATDFVTSTSAAVVVTVALGGPTVVRAASLAGAAKVGGVLVCNTGTFAGATTYAYAFLRNGVAQANPTNAFTRTLLLSDFNTTYSCRVTGINPAGSAISTTAGVKVAAGSAAIAVTKPRILFSGSAVVGRVFTAYRGVWSPVATYTYTYTWKRNGVIISRASTYRASALDRGKYLTLTVTAARTGYLTGTAVSAAVRVL